MPMGHVHMQHPSLPLLLLVLMVLLLVGRMLVVEVQLCPLPLPRLLRYHVVWLVLYLLWLLWQLLVMVVQLRRLLQAGARGRGGRLSCWQLYILPC